MFKRNPITKILCAGVCTLAAGPLWAVGKTTFISVDPVTQAQPDSDSMQTSISGNGRYVAFRSYATNLVANDTNNANDIFVYDRVTNTLKRVSVNSAGEEGNDASANPAISADGNFVAFNSYANNLKPDAVTDINSADDVFVFNRNNNTLKLISIAANGSNTGNGPSVNPSVSANGRFVAFESTASDLIAADGNGHISDIFVRDTLSNAIKLISKAYNGGAANGDSSNPAISADGRYVAYTSSASNLVNPDTNGKADIFLYDRVLDYTRRISVENLTLNQADGHSSNPAISADGRYIAFNSYATNLLGSGQDTNGVSDTFVYDRVKFTTQLVSVDSSGNQANGPSGVYSGVVSISADGRFVAFDSDASNLIANDTNGLTDVFVRDLKTRKTTVVSVANDGTLGNSISEHAAISADGRYVSFSSNATNFTSNDFAGSDIFLRDRYYQIGKNDIAVSQTDSPDPAQLNGTVTYTVNVSNLSNKQANNVTLVDFPPFSHFPGKISLLSVAPSQGTCSKAAVIVCRIGNMSANSNAQVVIKVKPGVTGLIVNKASVSSNRPDPIIGNNGSAAITTVQ
ncbi:MAG: calcium-binding protein [Gammaproteobacteria bacterium]